MSLQMPNSLSQLNRWQEIFLALLRNNKETAINDLKTLHSVYTKTLTRTHDLDQAEEAVNFLIDMETGEDS